MQLGRTLKTAVLVGFVGLAAGAATPAYADEVYAHCEGDRCWKVACDWDNCRRVPIRTGWHGDYGYDPSWRADRRYYDRDRERFYRHHHFDHRSGAWVCDGSSEYCRWSARRW
jgi:hypothetical protein